MVIVNKTKVKYKTRMAGLGLYLTDVTRAIGVNYTNASQAINGYDSKWASDIRKKIDRYLDKYEKQLAESANDNEKKKVQTDKSQN